MSGSGTKSRGKGGNGQKGGAERAGVWGGVKESGWVVGKMGWVTKSSVTKGGCRRVWVGDKGQGKVTGVGDGMGG